MLVPLQSPPPPLATHIVCSFVHSKLRSYQRLNLSARKNEARIRNLHKLLMIAWDMGANSQSGGRYLKRGQRESSIEMGTGTLKMPLLQTSNSGHNKVRIGNTSTERRFKS